MPRYDFVCQECDHSFEVKMSMSEYSDSGPPICPRCGAEDTERSFGSVSVLTGSGGGSRGSSRSEACGPAGSGFT